MKSLERKKIEIGKLRSTICQYEERLREDLESFIELTKQEVTPDWRKWNAERAVAISRRLYFSMRDLRG